VTVRDETISGRKAEEEGFAAKVHPPDSLKIEHDIEVTLSQMRGTLNEIQENLSPGRMFAPVKTFFASPAGRALLALGGVAIARRRPFSTAAAALGVIVFLYRRSNRRISR
jgi:hypothetical protein